MAAVTIYNDFGAPKIKSVPVSIISTSICHEVMGPDAMLLIFWMLSFKPNVSLSSFIFIKRLFSYLLSAITVVPSAYLRLLISLPAILSPACASSSPAFLRYSGAAARSLQLCPTLCDPTDGSPPGSSVPGFSRQEYWSGLSFPSLGWCTLHVS